MTNADRPYVRNWLSKQLHELFEECDFEAALNWMCAHRQRPKVILIGSGFSRNAELKPDQLGTVVERVPLWSQLTSALRSGLGYFDDSEGPTDPLLVAEQYQESLGREKFVETLQELLKDGEISPGEAHNALHALDVEAIITTNQLDTLLDRMNGGWYRVVDNTELPIARARAGRGPKRGSRQVIYIHGHREAPKTWVFSRSEYEKILDSRSALVRRVQQLLSEYPLLVLGYSLSDPDFHWLFSSIHKEQEGFMPRALCVTVGARPREAERAHWRQMGMHLAHLKTTNESTCSNLSKFLRLDEQSPNPKDIISSLQSRFRSSAEESLAARLEEFELSLDDLKNTSQESQARHVFEAWCACLPTYPHEPQPHIVQLDRAVPPLDNDRRYPQLPKRLEQLASGETINLLEGCQRFLDSGGTRKTLGTWLECGRRHRIRSREALTLGDTYEQTLSVLRDAFIEAQPGGTHLRQAESTMQTAHEAALRADWVDAAQRYQAAGRIFERRGDHLGEWQAQSSALSSIHAKNFLHRGSDFRTSEIELRIRQLESTREVIDYKRRRNRIMVAAFKEAQKRSTPQAPTGFSFSVSTAYPELRGLLEEEKLAGTFPGHRKDIAELCLNLEGKDETDLFELGLDYHLSKLGDRLTKQEEPLERQRELDKSLSKRIVSTLEQPKTGDVAYIAELLPQVAHRLTVEAARKCTELLSDELKKSAGSFETPYGVTSEIVIINALKSLLQFGESPIETLVRLRSLEQFCQRKNMQFDFWSLMADFNWTRLARESPQVLSENLEWVLSNRASLNENSKHLGAIEKWERTLLQLLAATTRIKDAHSESAQLTIDSFLASLSDYDPLKFKSFQSIGNAKEAVALVLQHADRWNENDRKFAMWVLRQAGVNPTIGSVLRARLETDLQELLQEAPGSLFVGLVENTMIWAALGFALGLEPQMELKELLFTLAAHWEQAPLKTLEYLVKDGSSESESLIRFVLDRSGSSVRDYHVMQFANAMIRENHLSGQLHAHRDVLRYIARRSLGSDHPATAAAGAQLLVLLASRFGFEPNGISICASYPNSYVRAATGYWVGVERQRLERDLANEVLERLRVDHSAYVWMHVEKGSLDSEEMDSPPVGRSS